jgi:hypothetical protein
MEWRQIEEKWMEMTFRLQAVPATARLEELPNGTAENGSHAGSEADAAADHAANLEAANTPAMA